MPQMIWQSLFVLALSLTAAHSLPARCSQGNASDSTPPAWLQRPSAYLDFIGLSGKRTVMRYSIGDKQLAMLRFQNFNATYWLYDAKHSDVSTMQKWPAGPCSSQPIYKNTSSDAGLPSELLMLKAALDAGKAPQIVSLAFGNARLNTSELRVQRLPNKLSIWRTCQGNDTLFTEITALVDPEENVIGLHRTVWNSSGNASYTVLKRNTVQFLAKQLHPEQQLAIANTPDLVACNSGREGLLRPPRLPDSLQLKVEEQLPEADAQPHHWEATLDSANRIAARRLWPSSGTRPELLARFGPAELLIIDDVSVNATYYVDAERRNCTAQSLVNDALFMNSTGQLLHGWQLLQLDSKEWRYTGNSSSRGQRCARFLLVLASKSQLHQACFANNTLIEYTVANSNNASVISTMFVQQIAPHQLPPPAFDISFCYDSKKVAYLLLKLSATNQQLMTLGKAELASLTRSNVSAVTGLSALHISGISLLLKNDDADKAGVAVTLLSDGGDKSPSIETALQRMKTAIAKGELKIAEFPVASVDRLRQPASQPIINRYGHSGAAMAFTAFCTLLLGAAAGIGAAWYRWKRAPNMPYYVQD